MNNQIWVEQIIEKFSDYSNTQIAIILLSADDVGHLKTSPCGDRKFRARQNVIFEFGYFIGKLGRDKVIALYEEGVKGFEMPSDYSGVIYLPYDKNGKWKFELIKELKAMGLDIDTNKII